MERLSPTAPLWRTVLELLCFVQLLVLPSVTAQMETRIIGGQPCEKRQPWMAALFDDNNDTFCGGALISKDWILTAAHCLEDCVHTVRLGVFDLRQSDEYVEEKKPSKIIPHHKYNSFTKDNDIMLIKLDSPVNINKNVHPIKLARRTASPGTNCLASGWGTTISLPAKPSYPDLLQCANLQIVSKDKCQKAYPHKCQKAYFRPITDNMLCAGVEEGGIDTCQGDSGGPLLCDGTLQGIVSFGLEKCAQPQTPGVFAKVSNYINWIKKTIRDE